MNRVICGEALLVKDEMVGPNVRCYHYEIDLVARMNEPDEGARMTRSLWNSVSRRFVSARWPLAGFAGFLIVLACVLTIPHWLVRQELGASERALSAADKAKAINDVRATLLQGIGGAAILLGAYFTYRQLQTGREQLRIAQQGQITERFTRAIDQLGNTELDVRLGAIYALERIANDSPNDRTTIAEILTAFVRGHAPWPPRLAGQYRAEVPLEQLPDLQVRAPDIQAAVTVLGRRQPPPYASGFLDLHATDLRKADLAGAQLQRVILRRAGLQGAFLAGAQLDGAFLDSAQLQGADLVSARLRKAILGGAQLQGAHLVEARLQGALLTGAQLQGAILARAQLQEANLILAQLQGANLAGAQLQEANLNLAELQEARLAGAQFTNVYATEHTKWPTGFDARRAGVLDNVHHGDKVHDN